jgi:erythritol transport system ATP-binding protein
MGAGRSELFECLMGLHPNSIGRISVDGERLDRASVSRRIQRGLSLVPEDRQREGLVQALSVKDNLTLASIGRFATFFNLDLAKESAAAREMIRRMTIKVSSPDVEVTALSGGNQQKVVIGKALMTEPRVILLDEPSRGVDVGAKMEIFRSMRRLSDQGLAILFATSDLKEVLGLSDRIIVMSKGRITGEFTRGQASEAALIEASAAGHGVDQTLERQAS